ncbi:MAG TPA: RsmB/NOP family class I SAM-dependent RNA methyltransferase, partial [Sandaracinaceae bacterium]
MDPRGPTIASRRDVELVYGRYRELAGDFAAFVAALEQPLDPVVWAHPERLARDELAALLEASGIASTPVAWEPTALRLHGVDRPGLHWAHGAGLYYVQEEASLLPAHLLGARPGERVLDLCAAPGSKTARIALAMRNRGTLIANDRSAQRMAAVAAVVARLGLTNVTCTIADGATYPLTAGPFDRVLVDAPCSAEGNGAKNACWRAPDPDFRAWITGQQRALLRRAAHLCRAGGRIVYSTCTLAPEENELVVDAVVRELDGAVRVVPVPPVEGLRTSPAVLSWNGRTLLPEVAHARRLWPHVSGTGGFFVAVLEKRAPAREERGTSVREMGIDARESETLARFADAFGFGDDVWDGLVLLERGRHARLVADDHVLPVGPRLVATGLPITRNKVRSAKLSTA